MTSCRRVRDTRSLTRLVCLRAQGGGHVEHHAETLDDMSLRATPQWRKSSTAVTLNDDKYRGTAFSWETTKLMLGQQALTSYPILLVSARTCGARARLRGCVRA